LAADAAAQHKTGKEFDRMVSKKLFHNISEVSAVQQLAEQCPADVALHSPDSTTIIDAKSYIGLYALDFRQPVLVVSEDAEFHRAIRDIGDNVA
jgi:hypothetical protein